MTKQIRPAHWDQIEWAITTDTVEFREDFPIDWTDRQVEDWWSDEYRNVVAERCYAVDADHKTGLAEISLGGYDLYVTEQGRVPWSNGLDTIIDLIEHKLVDEGHWIIGA